MPDHYLQKYFESIPITLKKIILSDDIQMKNNAFSNIYGVTIYVEGLEKDLRWDDNYPGWNNGNTVVYGDKWVNVNFYDHLGNLISSNIFTTNQVIRVPYLEVEGNAMYSYVVEGFDIDGDGIADTIPATSSVDINAVAVVKQVLNTYTVNFYDGENVLYSFELPYGNTVTLPDAPSKMGYDFLGWEGYTEGMIVEDNVNIYSLWSHHGDGHVYGEAVTILPTCEGEGYDKHVCDICGEWYGDNVVPAIGHNYSETVVAPTCENEGYTLHSCDCGHSYEDNFTGAKGHSFSEWSIIKDADCTTDGERERTCTVCSHKETEVIPATGHSYKSEVICEATCEREGSVEYTCTCTETGLNRRDCKVCGHYETEVVKANGHKPANAVVENRVEPDCTTDGKYDNVVYCSVCNTELSRETISIIDKLGHDYSSEWTVDTAPTCTEQGTKSHHCTRCNDKADVTEIPANGHTNAIPVVENRVEPNCTTDGSYDSVVYCSVCTDELSRTNMNVDKLGHVSITDISVEPTCTGSGLTEGSHCDRCGEILVAQEEISALGHNSVTDTGIAPTCTETGLMEGSHCDRCDEILVSQEVIPALGHSWLDATHEAPSTCERCGATTGEKLPEENPPEENPPTDDDSTEDEHVCEGVSGWQKFWNAVINFFRRIFGIPEKCPHGINKND